MKAKNESNSAMKKETKDVSQYKKKKKKMRRHKKMT